jgi:hypothetical protein
MCSAEAQIRFSVSPDISLMRNFSPKQKFWALGETVQGNVHFSPKETMYAWISYYTPGKFKNNLIADAKSSATSPLAVPFRATSKWRNNEFSIGWKHFFKGAFDYEDAINIYGLAGFGLMFTKVENVFNTSIDTAQYNVPVLPGNNKFNRLTLDLGIGAEYPLGADFFIYTDLRTWIPASDYPSKYLVSNKNVPRPFMISAGLRILFDY